MRDYKTLRREVEVLLAEPEPERPEYITLSKAHELATQEMLNPPPAMQVVGWPLFNQATGGLRPKEFSILCGTSGTGKTTWTANLSANLLVSGVRQFVASVETGYTDYVLRTMSALDQKDYNTGCKYDKAVTDKFAKNYAQILKSNGLFLAPYLTKIDPMRILCDLLYMHEEHGCKVAVLDNLNFFLPYSESGEANASMDRVIHDFITFVKHVEMHVIMIMHPRKLMGKEANDRRIESLDDIKGSSGAPQEAHNVFFFNRLKKEDEDRGYDRGIHRDLLFGKLRRRGGYFGRRIVYQNAESSYIEKELL